MTLVLGNATLGHIDPPLISLRFFCVYRLVMEEGAPVWTAVEAVAATARERPEVDLDEMRTWDEWVADN